MLEENNVRFQEESEPKSRKVWKNIGYGALAFFLAAVTVVVICL